MFRVESFVQSDILTYFTHRASDLTFREEISGRVLRRVTMSLDSFIAGPDDGMDWMVRCVGPNPAVGSATVLIKLQRMFISDVDMFPQRID